MNSTIVLQEPKGAYGGPVLSTVVQPKELVMLGGDSSIYLSKPRYFPPAVASLLQKLSRLAALKENWDSYGAETPSAEAVQAATDFIVGHFTLDLPFYFIAPGVNGEIMLEMSRGNKAAEIYFNADGSAEVLMFENDEVYREGALEDNFTELINFFND